MTIEEKMTILDAAKEVAVQPSEPMRLDELKAYVKGYEDARDALLSSVGECYRSMKTD
mgnify:CR=1 FL=1